MNPPPNATVLARLAWLALLLPALAGGAAREYRIDPVHSRVLFTADHLGFSRALGTLSAPRGRLRFDPDDWSSAQVEVEIELATLDLGNRDWNARMLRRDFLDAGRAPIARFVSTAVEAGPPGRARVHGMLELRGQRVPVTLEVTLNRIGRNPLTLRRTVGFSAEATLSRAAFGMRAWNNVVGDRIELRIEVEAQRSRRRRDDADAMEE